MEKEIKLGLLEGISVGFENVESVYVPSTYIHNLQVKEVKVNKYLDNNLDESQTMRELTISNYVNLTIKEYGDTEEILSKSGLFSTSGDSYSGYMRLFRSNDITSIDYIFKDGSTVSLYVDYSDEDMYYDPNTYQVNTPVIEKEVPNGVNICIASPKTLALCSEMEGVTPAVGGVL